MPVEPMREIPELTGDKATEFIAKAEDPEPVEVTQQQVEIYRRLNE
jgi:hypothetical protein